MTTKIFVNLPVKDLPKSMDFYKKLGYSFNMNFTDDTAACLVISEEIYAMLLTHPKFKSFIRKEIADATKTIGVLLALAMESRERVNQIADMAEKSGGKQARPPEDHGFMYTRIIEDPDGHIWEFFWMDEKAVPTSV